jgi:hypothetical protein
MVHPKMFYPFHYFVDNNVLRLKKRLRDERRAQKGVTLQMFLLHQ